ncbi:MAG TPA: adenylate/guanylate cyclase domain-containing protein [Anaerolineales bacterium]|nr:adenylate/guanylate cyclase domain-containing protein [Anaerolineales bacterium]
MDTQNLPSGTVTFLFTDIEGSTKLWEQHPEAMKVALSKHDEILRKRIEAHHGHIIKTTGDGVHAVFATALDGASAALDVQQALTAAKWGEIEPQNVKIRVGLHTGEAEMRAGDYYGPVLNRAARLMSVGHGGQTLLSTVTADLVREHLSDGSSLRDLGEHRLKDLIRSEHVFQLTQPGLPADFPPLRSLDSYPNNLPIQLTSFIGRERELAEAKKRLASARLLTLIGPGGTGKTRLSMQIGAELLPMFADGVWLVELAPLADPALILQTIASIFGIREQVGMSLTELVVDYLRAKNLLLIMDNCEHLIEACAQLADQLLHACAHLKIVASSREALGISGETVYRVPSLSLPNPDEATREALTQSESAQLFIERAMAANPKFELSDKNASSVAQICRRLDGIPLALELAAARITVFSVEQIASRLDDRFRLLTGGSRTALPRQQTLRALIDWSYDMLAEEERALLRRLSVFAGGWTFDAADAICPKHDVLNLLTQLVNKSLVIFDEEGSEPRYRMLETVRQYARDKLLEMGESEEARNAHLDFFFQFTEAAAPKVEWLLDLVWVTRLEAEHDNFRAALEWGLEKNIEAVLRMVWNLSNYWWLRGHEAEGRQWATMALAKADALPVSDGETGSRLTSLRAHAYQALAMVTYSQGDNAHAMLASERAAALADQLGDKRLLALALSFEIFARLFVADTKDTEEIAQKALDAARESGDQYALGISLAMVGRRLAVIDGNNQRGQKYFEEAMTILQQSGNRWGYTMTLLGSAMTEKYNGNYAEARRIFMACDPLFREMGDRHRMNMIKSELGHIDRYEGNYQKAKDAYKETIVEWKRIGHRAAIAHQLECFAGIAKVEEQGGRAARLFGAAEALREKIDIPMTAMEKIEYDREIADLKAGMEEKVFIAAWAEGRAMSVDQAVDLALERGK